jgi:hypothetical protein
MPGLVPGIHVFLTGRSKTWMAGTSPAMTELDADRYFICGSHTVSAASVFGTPI